MKWIGAEREEHFYGDSGDSLVPAQMPWVGEAAQFGGSNEIKRFHCRQSSLQSSLLRCVTTFETEVFLLPMTSGGGRGLVG